MSSQQAEGWDLWEKLMVMPRQALRRTGASVPRRDRLASVLVVLLTGTLLLGTSAFGQGLGGLGGLGETVKDLYDKAARELEKAPEPVSCPDGYAPDSKGNCAIVSCPEGSTEATSQANLSRIAKEIAEGLVIRFGIEGAYEYVNQRFDGERGEKITFADASLLFLAIGAIEEEEWRAPRSQTETGPVDTARGILRRKVQAEAAADLEIGTLRIQSGFLASGFSQMAEWAGGSKAAQIFCGNVGRLIGKFGEALGIRANNYLIQPEPDVQWPGRRDQYMREWSQ